MSNGGAIVIDLDLMTDAFRAGISETNKAINSLGNNVRKQNNIMTSSFNSLKRSILSCFSIAAITAFSKSCIDLGSDLAEVQNVVDVTFGGSSKTIDSWAKSVKESFGLSELSAKQYAGTMGAMLKSSGLAGEAVTDMSMRLAELSGDMASFYNLSTDEAFQKIRAGISGETEPLKQLGINLSVANLEAYALSQGITKSYKAMSQAEQATLRYNYLLQTTADAQGDFARTSNSWANQVRILQLNFESLKATLGQAFINVLTPLIQQVNILMGYLQKAADAFLAFTSAIFGSQSTTVSTTSSAIADNMSSISGDAASAAKSIDKMTTSFDELHKVSSGTAGSGAGGIGSIITTEAETITGDDGIMNKFEDDINKFLASSPVKAFLRMWDSIKSTISTIAGTFSKMWNEGHGVKISSQLERIWVKICDGISNAFTNFEKYWNSMSGYYDESGKELTWGELIVDDIYETVEGILGFVEKIVEKIGEIVANIDWAYVFEEWHKTLEKIKEVLEKVTKLLGYTDSEGIGSILTKILAHIPQIWLACKFADVISNISSIIGVAGGTTGLQGIITAIAGGGGLTAVAGALANSALFWIADISLGLYAINGIIENTIGLFTTLGEAIAENLPEADGGLFEGGRGGGGGGGGGKASRGQKGISTPALANGGYVGPNSPRLVTIGDNKKYGEIVANDGQLKALEDRIVTRIVGNGATVQNGNSTIEVYIGQEKLENVITKTITKNNYRRGGRS